MRVLPGKGEPASRKRVLRGVPGDRSLRSVDSERVGRVIEPRKGHVVDADGVGTPEGSTRRSAIGQGTAGSTGGADSGACEQGLPQEPGRTCRLRLGSGRATRTKPRPAGVAFVPVGANTGRRDGTAARRHKRRVVGWAAGVGSLRSTCEAGTATRATPRREGSDGSRNRWRERCAGRRARRTSQRNEVG